MKEMLEAARAANLDEIISTHLIMFTTIMFQAVPISFVTGSTRRASKLWKGSCKPQGWFQRIPFEVAQTEQYLMQL